MRKLLSTLIIEGAAKRPQAFNHFFHQDGSDPVGSCALAAAFEVLHPELKIDAITAPYELESLGRTIQETLNIRYNVPLSTCTDIIHLNDNSRMSREEIAEHLKRNNLDVCINLEPEKKSEV